MVGTTCKQYRIDALLGRGGMGKVYRAQDTRLDRLVAIKVMGAGARRAGVPADSFLQEARAASALNHPNIVTIHEIIETESGDLLMVQEFVPGRTLRDFVNAPLPMERAVDIARQLVRAIGAAHRAGVVHRDIKPENVMVRPDGYVKVLDFGLAHRTRHRQPGHGRHGRGPPEDHDRGPRSSERSRTCRPSRRPGRASTAPPTCSPSASSSTRC